MFFFYHKLHVIKQECVVFDIFNILRLNIFFQDFINRRKLTEFGNLALVEEREESEGGPVAIKLPGVRRGDMSSRVIKPEVRHKITSLFLQK